MLKDNLCASTTQSYLQQQGLSGSQANNVVRNTRKKLKKYQPVSPSMREAILVKQGEAAARKAKKMRSMPDLGAKVMSHMAASA